MSLDSAVAYFRTRQRALLRSCCTIVRPVGAPEFDPDTEEVTQAVEPVYQGVCNVRPADRLGSDATVSEREVRINRWTGKLPVDTDVEINDLLVVTESRYDAALVGLQFRVTDVAFDDYQIARVVALELVTGLPALVQVVGS